MTHAIETFALERRFGSLEAVCGLDLQVPQGSIFALVGPNGAGKTTTLKMLMNLIRPSGGRATVLGCDSRRLGPAEFQRIGYVSENQELPGWMTPADLFDYCRPLYRSWDVALERQLREDLDLETGQPLRQLSRGTRMKAALLSSLAYRPDLVILDEPFSGLDPLVRDELTRGLLGAAGDRPWSVVVSSHDIDEVERLADWVGFIDRGRLAFAEPVASLLDRFRRIEVVAPEGEAPALPEGVSGLTVERAGRTLRFIDDHHTTSDVERHLSAAVPGAAVNASPVPLREIFVTLAREKALRRRSSPGSARERAEAV